MQPRQDERHHTANEEYVQEVVEMEVLEEVIQHEIAIAVAAKSGLLIGAQIQRRLQQR